MNHARDAELKLIERLMELIERAFKVVRQAEERDEHHALERALYLERKAKYEARKQKKEKQNEQARTN